MHAVACLQIVVRALKPDSEGSFNDVEELRSLVHMFVRIAWAAARKLG